jgi:pyruvate/2-oxoglutarate dehydrogenase complex dihydrolipoamide acyltransferase (E2) component
VSALSVALAHYRRRAQTARLLEQQAAALWRQIDSGDIAGSWADLMPRLAATITLAQHAEADAADAYVAAATAAQGETGAAEADIVASAWTGVASDGRPLGSLLMQPVISAKTALADGRGLQEALNYGQAVLQMITSTQVTDAGRTADQVAMVTRNSQGYVRMVVGNACSRCAVLAGRWYRWNAGFDRHPNCKCVGIPAAEDKADAVSTNPDKYFRSLSHTEQDQIFGKAGAQAIRDGADMGQVVNARSGMYTAGSQKMTSSGTSRRALYGGFEVTPDGRLVRLPRGVKAPPRLMPEAIYTQARGDRAEAMRLLHKYGYITDPAKANPAVPAAAKPKAAVKPKAANLGKFHLPGDPVEDLAKAARQAASKDAVRAKLGGGQSADTELVTLPDGRKFVTKRGSDWGDKSAETQADVRHQAEAEQLASLVGRAIGAPVVRVYRSAADRVWMDWQEGRVFGDLPSGEQRSLVEGRDGQMLGLLDHLIGNVDRNDGNMLVHEGRLIGIDHGWSWTPDTMSFAGPIVQDAAGRPAAHFSQSREWWVDNPLTARILRARLEALRPNFERVGRSEWLDYTLARLDLLARRAKGMVDLIG